MIWQKQSQILGTSFGATHTGDLIETVLSTFILPAGTLAAGRGVSVSLLASQIGGVGNKRIRVRLGGLAGVEYSNNSFTTGTLGANCRIYADSNNTQLGYPGGSGITAPHGTTSVAITTSALDSTLEIALVVTVILGAAGDTGVLDAVIVERL